MNVVNQRETQLGLLNLAEELGNVASEKPCRRHSFLIAIPVSASRRKPMICSSVKRFFTSNLLVGGIGL